MFVSLPTEGRIYVARQSRKSAKFVWTTVPVEPTTNETRIDATEVPREIRVKAYKLFEADRNRRIREKEQTHV